MFQGFRHPACRAFLPLALVFVGTPACLATGLFFCDSDYDYDLDVDNWDFAIVLSQQGIDPSFTGLGDANGDGVTDSFDFDLTAFDFGYSDLPDVGGTTEFFDLLIVSGPTSAQLLYDPSTGNVLLDQTNAPGGAITNFILSTDDGAFLTENVSYPFPITDGDRGSSDYIHDTIDFEIAQTAPNPSLFGNPFVFLGFPTDVHNLGPILPTGLDLAGLDAFLEYAVYVGSGLETGIREFELSLINPGLPGDYNDNGVVDAADYTVWRDGDSPDSSQAGYDLWSSNYGTVTPSLLTAASVPEPSACLLVILSAVILSAALASRRRTGY